MGNRGRFDELFKPGRIGKMEVKNRIVMAAMGMRLGDEGYVTERLKDYYAERARGGVGLITVEATCIDSLGRNSADQLSIGEDRFIEGLRGLAHVIKECGARAALQLHHAGNVAHPPPGVQTVGASAIARPGYPVPRELNAGEIKGIVALFARAAGRAREAGFDGVEIQGGHHYLIAQFLSPTWNKRRDEYGGSLANRARLLLEVIEAARKEVGEGYPLWIKMNGAEYAQKEVFTTGEAREVAVMAQKAGVDAILVSGDPCYYPHASFFLAGIPPNLPLWRPGYFLGLAETIKKAVTIPVMAVGWMTPEIAEKALRRKKVDFIVEGRQLIADPEFPNKIAQGRRDEVRPCVYCSSCVPPIDPKYLPPGAPPKQCTVNPAYQREREYAIRRAEVVRNVVVAGGGPAGMEAARVAALRGHKVVLYERGKDLGGLLPFAAVINPQVGMLDKYLRNQIKKLGITVKLGEELTPAEIEKARPDVVIWATGAAASLPEIPGIEGKNVISTATVQDMLAKHPLQKPRLLWRMGLVLIRLLGPSTVRRLSRFVSPFGKKIVIMNGGLDAYELADFLVERGKKVTLVETAERFPGSTPGVTPMPVVCEFLLEKLIFGNVPMLSGVKYEAITDKGLAITDKHSWFRTIEADTIVVTGTRRVKEEAMKAPETKATEVYFAGDCAEPRGILEAIRAGFQAGLKI